MSPRRQHRYVPERVADGGNFAQIDTQRAGVPGEPERLVARPKMLDLATLCVGPDPRAGTEAAREPGDCKGPGNRDNGGVNPPLPARFQRPAPPRGHAVLAEGTAQRPPKP